MAYVHNPGSEEAEAGGSRLPWAEVTVSLTPKQASKQTKLTKQPNEKPKPHI